MGLSRANVQTSVPLSNLSLKVANALPNFKAEAIFPKRAVAKGSGKIRVYSGDNMIQSVAPGGRRDVAQEIERKYSTLSFETLNFKLREFISKKDLRDADADIGDIEMDATADLTERLLLGREKAMITKAFTSTNFASGFSSTPGNNWDTSSGTPIVDIDLAKNTILKGLGGLPADSMAMSPLLYSALCRHPDVVDRVKYVMGSVAVVNETALSALFGLQVHVIAAVENTAPLDTAGTVTKAFANTSSSCLVYRSAGADGLRSSAFGRMLVPPGGDFAVRRYLDEAANGQWIEAEHEYALQFTAVDSASSGKSIGGYLLIDLL